MINYKETDGTEKHGLVEITILMSSGDRELIRYLSTKNNITQDELRSLGTILIQAWRLSR